MFLADGRTDGQTDRQTEKMRLIVAFCNFAKVPNTGNTYVFCTTARRAQLLVNEKTN